MSYGKNSSNGAGGAIILGLILCLPFVFVGCSDFMAGISYEQEIGGYLKRAADANTTEMAKRELDRALVAIEDRNYNKGSTHVLWKTPDCDVGFWYENLKTSSNELGKVTPETSQLERTNQLMKLRETLLDHKEHGDSVTHPPGIDIFPNNTAYFIGYIVTGLMGCVGVLFVMLGCKDL